MSCRFLPLLTAGLLGLATAGTALAATLQLSFNGGAWKLTGPTEVQAWANSPAASLAVDAREQVSYQSIGVHWRNLIAGSYLATPQGVVVGGARDGGELRSRLEVAPGEHQRWSLNPNVAGDYRFAVIGDTRGQDGSQATFGALGKAMGQAGVRFAIHLGDAVANGNARDMAIFRDQLAAFPFPTYAVPGNEDLLGRGRAQWRSLFGRVPLSFAIENDHFLLVDNAFGTIAAQDRAWLERSLARARASGARHVFVFMHQPPVDPRPGLSFGMDSPGEVRSLLGLFARQRVTTVFAGHLAMFHAGRYRGVDQVVTGGGGARLQATPAAGGFHHFTQVEVAGTAVEVTPVRP